MEVKNILVTITANLMLSQHSISQSGDLKEIIKVVRYSPYFSCHLN